MSGTSVELAERYTQGATIAELANERGWTYRKVRSELIRAGIAFRAAAPRTSTAPLGLVAEYEAGASINELAASYDMSFGRTRRMLLREGVKLRPRGGNPHARERER